MKVNIKCVQKALVSLVFLCTCVQLRAVNYYFSTSQGDNSRTVSQAQNAATPWKSIDKLNVVFSQLNPGDSILFKAGEIFYGSIVANQSGGNSAPIVFASYGSGGKPQITGFITPSGWVSSGANTWEAVLPVTPQRVNSVVVNGTSKAAGRYPNANAANKGYLNFESAQGTSSITDLQLSGSPNWTGGEVVIRKARWVIDRNMITQHQGNTISYTTQSGYGASAGYGYFIQNHPQTLDQNGEWYYQASGSKFGIYTTTGAPATGSIQVCTVINLVSIVNQSNFSFINLSFTGANDNAFYFDHARNVVIKNCELRYGYNGMTAWNSNDLTIESCIINQVNNNACKMEGCNNIILKNNTISCTGAFAGMGDGDSGSYEALLLSGSNQLIEGNTIDSTGYIAVTFRGSNVVVKNNVISNFSFVKDDGSGIYTWNNVSNPPAYTGEVISNNIVLNGLGAGEGTPDPNNRYANGIYMDDNAGGVEISGNTVTNCANYGFYIHNAHDLVIQNNTVYNNAVQLEMTHDDIAPYPIRNVTMTGNTFVAKTASQSVAEFKTNGNDISSFGTFDDNYYSRPFFDDLQIGVLTYVNGNYNWTAYNLEGWKGTYGKDQHSKQSPVSFAPFKVNSYVGSNLFSNGNFNSNISELNVSSDANNATASWNNSVLDGGALQIASSGNSGSSNATVVLNTGSVVSGHNYVLKFSLKGTVANKVMGTYLRQGSGSYSDLVTRNYLSTTGNRSEHQFLFSPASNAASTNVVFVIPDVAGTVYIDNVQLTEASVTTANPDDSIKLVYNASAISRPFPLDAAHIDMANNTYASSITLAAYRSAVLLKKSSTQTTPVDTSVVCSATGSILREQWSNISGNDVSNIPQQTAPAGSSHLTIFEGPTDVADNYGDRIRGYICPPFTGNYNFWIAADDAAELWLSTDSNSTNKVKIAYNLSYTASREWNKFSTQQSASVYLQAGRKYYIESLHKEGNGGDNLAVAWQLPDGTMERPIPGSRLSPFIILASNQTITFPAISAKYYGDAPFAVSAIASSGLAVSFSIVSGPATISGNTITLIGTGTVIVEASQAGNTVYNAATPVTQSFEVSTAPVSPCTNTGTILREQWNNIWDNNISSIPVQNTPDVTSQLTLFEAPSNIADYYGARVRGYICPPLTGNYTFWIAADDLAELWLSTSDDAGRKVKIASVLSYTDVREWNKYASQKSSVIYLQAGQRYYIEALHKEGNGGDHLSVAWQLPNGTMEAPIAGSRLSSPASVILGASCTGAGSIVREQWNSISGNNISSIPLQTTPASISTLTLFEAPSNMADNYGARVRGFLCPPLSGSYIFWVAADDAAQLWLSNSSDPADKAQIASVPAYTASREWTKYASQQSAAVYLQAGQLYYVEAIHKEGDGGDNFAVGWQLPNGSIEAPIPGMRLLPFSGTAATRIVYNPINVAGIQREEKRKGKDSLENAIVLKVYPNPFSNTAIIEINLKKAEEIKLDVSDEQGRIVKRIANGLIENTIHKFELNRSGLTSGIYIVRLITQTKNITQKVIVER